MNIYKHFVISWYPPERDNANPILWRGEYFRGMDLTRDLIPLLIDGEDRIDYIYIYDLHKSGVNKMFKGFLDTIDVILDKYGICEIVIQKSNKHIIQRLIRESLIYGQGLEIYFRSKSLDLLNNLISLFPTYGEVCNDFGVEQERYLKHLDKILKKRNLDEFLITFSDDVTNMFIFAEDTLLNQLYANYGK